MRAVHEVHEVLARLGEFTLVIGDLKTSVMDERNEFRLPDLLRPYRPILFRVHLSQSLNPISTAQMRLSQPLRVSVFEHGICRTSTLYKYRCSHTYFIVMV